MTLNGMLILVVK